MDRLTASTFSLVISEQTTQPPKIDDGDADLVVNASDGTLKVHKSVVKSCSYFAAMTDGNWLESQSSVINLDTYSYKSIRFIIEHLYEPKVEIDTNQNIAELLALGDMLGLSSLLELVCSTLVIKVCHNFHKPCKDCIDGVMCSFQLASTYYITDIQHRCLEWISKHFTKTWNSRTFANLPEPMQQSCLESVKSSMNVNNIIDVSLNCQQLQEMLPSVKWVEPVNNLVKQLYMSCMTFIQEHFQEILHSIKFKSLMNQGDTWNLNRVEALFLEAIPNLPVEQACLSYLSLEKIMLDQLTVKEEQRPDPVYVNFIKILHKTVEARLVQRVGMATKCSAWDALPQIKQKSIMQMGFFDPIDTKANPKNPSVKVNARPNLKRNQSLNTSSIASDETLNSRTAGASLRREPMRQTVHGRTALRSSAPRDTNNAQAVRQSAPVPRSGTTPLQPNRGVLTARSQSANVATARTTPLNNRPIRNRSDCSTQLSANLTNSRTSTTR